MKISKLITIILCIEVFLVPLFFIPGAGARIGAISPLAFNKIILIIVLTLTAFFLFLAKSLEQGKIKITRTPLDYFILAFLLFYTLSYLFSDSRYYSLFSWLLVLSLVVFYFLVVNVIKRKDLLLSLIVWSAGLTAVVFLASTLFLRDIIGIINPLGTQSGLAAFVALAAVLVQTRLLEKPSEEESASPKASAGKEKKKIKLSVILQVVALALFLVIIALINFRVGWIVLTAGSLLIISLAMARADDLGLKKNWIVLPIIFALIGLFFLFLRTPLLYNADLPVEVSLSNSGAWPMAWKTSIKSVFGKGPSNFALAFSKYKPESFSGGQLWQLRFNQAPNQWLEILATTGWLGALSWLILFAMAGVVVFLQGSLLAIFLALLVASFYISFSPVWWLVLFSLIAATIKTGEAKEYSFKKSPYSRSLISLVFVVGIVLAIFVLSSLSRLYLADYHLRRGNISQALRYNERDPYYNLALAEQSLNTAAQAARENNATDATLALGQAVNQSKVALDLSPNDVAVCEGRALIFEQARGVVAGANEWIIDIYNQCLKLEPNNPFFMQQLGIAEIIAENEEAGIEHLKKSVELRPRMITAQYELGRIYFNQDKLELAEKHLVNALVVNRDFANALFMLGLVYEKQDRNTEALQLYRRVLELDPNAEGVRARVEELTE